MWFFTLDAIPEHHSHLLLRLEQPRSKTKNRNTTTDGTDRPAAPSTSSVRQRS